MGRILKAALAVAGAAALTLGITQGPAQAAADDRQVTTKSQATTKTVVAGQPTAAAAGCPVSAFGYSGTARCNSVAITCDWNLNGYDDEAFVIAPSGTIWHAWPNSGGWREMPNNGKAWNMWRCYWNGNGQRQVEVETYAGNYYYSYYSGGWKGWYLY